MYSSAQIEYAHAVWVARLVNAGWEPHLLTFMFRDIAGSPTHKISVMLKEIEKAYSIFITRVLRRPRSAVHNSGRPIWLGAFDYPVYKHEKQPLSAFLTNDGLHAHALLLILSGTRLGDVSQHFHDRQSIYLNVCPMLSVLDCRPVTHHAAYVDGYIRKSVSRGRLPEDRTFIYPRALSELPTK